MLNRLISVAPMMDWTDRHFRYFLRQMSRQVLLYTEMITTKALIHGDVDMHLAFDESEHPLALQLGGCDPAELAHCASLGEQYGYGEINLNVGCPSNSVQAGRFGACLLKESSLVAAGVAAMRDRVKIPVTVKTRIGVDEFDSYSFLCDFVEKVSATGCNVFIMHARKAWLKGLSPKQNRSVPPLRYDVVYQLKQDFPGLTIVLNGGVKTLAEVEQHLQHVDGVMIGREAYANPELFLTVDQRFYQSDSEATVLVAMQRILDYLEQQLTLGVRLSNMTRHLMGFFQGRPGARSWRRYLSEHANKANAGIEVVQKAAAFVDTTL